MFLIVFKKGYWTIKSKNSITWSWFFIILGGNGARMMKLKGSYFYFLTSIFSKFRIVLIDLTKLVFQGLVFDNRNVLHGMTDMRNQVDYAQYVYGTVLAR